MNSKLSRIVSVVALVLALTGARQAIAQTAPAAKRRRATATVDDSLIAKPWTGDFDGMVKRRMIRILTPYSKTHYFIDRGVQRGLVYRSGHQARDRAQREVEDGPRRQDSTSCSCRPRVTSSTSRSSTDAATSSPRRSPSRPSGRSWWTSPTPTWKWRDRGARHGAGRRPSSRPRTTCRGRSSACACRASTPRAWKRSTSRSSSGARRRWRSRRCRGPSKTKTSSRW